MLTTKAEWKPVPINVEGDFEGLIGIEEITDYNIENSRASNKLKTKLKKKKKTKLIKRSTDENEEPPVKKKKKKNEFIEESVTTEIEETDYYPWNNICVPREISQALLEKGFKEPTEIQRLAVPPALKGKKDILGAAETGSGKTLAFAIPVIYGILKNLEKEKEKTTGDGAETERRRLWALVLTPTRELALQVKSHIETALKYTPLKVAAIVGGMSADRQSRLLKGRPEILVATPGRLWDLITNSDEPHLNHIEDIRFLVIDETDRMVETNHFPELRCLIERLNADPELVKGRQHFVFSATLSLVHTLPNYALKNKRKKKMKKEMTSGQKLNNFIKLLGMSDPKIIDITQKSGTASGLTEAKIATSFDEKDFYLYYLLSVYPGRSLVFCNSISCVRRLASLLSALCLRPLPLHANMEQRQRLKNLDKFKSDSSGLLLATDLAARGLDIPSVEHVFHYQVPRTSETYIHRSGRTARNQRKGLTVLLVEPNEVKLYAKICATLDRDKDVPDFPVDMKALKGARERVKIAREIDKTNLALRKERSRLGWLEKTAQEMDLVLDEDQMPSKSGDEEIAKQKRSVDHLRKKLKNLLSVPLTLEDSSSATEALNKPKSKKKIKIIKKTKKS